MATTFFGFSTDAFEQFVRALCLQVFGPGVKAFGNGPDRGREAIFNGAIPYPFPPAQSWLGYGVIQAKCKEKSESSKIDQDWALKRLDEELELFVTSKKRTPKPEYFVFVTNIELSSAEKGWDAGETLIKTYYGKLPLKGHAIWDANQLSALLDSYSEIRKRFTAFLTPGDVLAELLEDLERRRPNAATILATFLERELRADENSRLDQAGNRTEDQLRLARLFFDLPAFAEQQLEPPEEQVNHNGNLPAGVLKELLIAGSRKLDAEAVHIEEVRTDANHGQPEFYQSYVLFGGPGSGKSTLGQFLGQIHRAALLERRPTLTLVKASKDAIRETRELCERDGLPWPTTPRFPVRVELSRFARRLQETSGSQSFAEYIRETLRGNHSFEHKDFCDWLAAYPWLLILDGLDEVPATSNRDAVIASVRDFLAEARHVGADLFIVATSRQQGYNDEFSGSLTAYRHLAPLSKPRALDYVRRYAMAKFGDHQQDARDNLVEKLTRAAERELTTRLMATPLQVTFMATVVSAQGEPGEDRWQLFEGYYRTIYDREKQKAVPPFNEVLSNHEGTISRLHYDIGFALQCEGETSADSGVTLSLSKFERLVDVYLSADGYDGEEKKRLVTLIVNAASQRLVFLTSRTKDELAFEVRSLQEFMAAERITSGNEETVEKRLSVIAPIRYWRNVFLFAASKCFRDARSRHLEGKPCSLCEELTRGEPVWEITRSGPDLALDLLQSGAATRKPAHGRTLTRLAFELLTEPDFSGESDGLASAARRLEQVLQSLNDALFQEMLGRLLGQSDPPMAANAWVLVLRLIGAEVPWAEQLAENHWPREVGRQVRLLKLLPESAANCWLHEKIAYVVPMVSIDDAKLLMHLLNGSELQPPWLLSVRAIFSKQATDETPLHFAEGMSEGIKIRFIRIDEAASSSKLLSLSELNWQDSSWLPFVLARVFIENPSCRSLARVLRECDANGWSPKNSYVNVLPWPLGACLRAAADGKSLQQLATAAENGELGDIDEWKVAEERWKRDGITIEDWTKFTMDDLPFEAGIGLAGFPATSFGASITSREYPEEVSETLISMVNGESNESAFENAMFFLACINRTSGAVVRRVGPSTFQQLLDRTENRRWNCNQLGTPSHFGDISNWIEFFDWFGQSDKLRMRTGTRNSDSDEILWMDVLHREFVADPQKTGLIRLIASLAIVGVPVPYIPKQHLDSAANLDLRFQFATILIRLTWPSLEPADAIEIAGDAARLLSVPAEDDAAFLLFRTIEIHLDSVPSLEKFLIRIHGIMPADVTLGRARCEQLLRKVVRRRSSQLKAEGVLEELDLPRLPRN